MVPLIKRRSVSQNSRNIRLLLKDRKSHGEYFLICKQWIVESEKKLGYRQYILNFLRLTQHIFCYTTYQRSFYLRTHLLQLVLHKIYKSFEPRVSLGTLLEYAYILQILWYTLLGMVVNSRLYVFLSTLTTSI